MQYGPKPLIDEWAWKPWKPVSSLWGLIVMTVLMGRVAGTCCVVLWL